MVLKCTIVRISVHFAKESLVENGMLYAITSPILTKAKYVIGQYLGGEFATTPIKNLLFKKQRH